MPLRSMPLTAASSRQPPWQLASGPNLPSRAVLHCNRPTSDFGSRLHLSLHDKSSVSSLHCHRSVQCTALFCSRGHVTVFFSDRVRPRPWHIFRVLGHHDETNGASLHTMCHTCTCVLWPRAPKHRESLESGDLCFLLNRSYQIIFIYKAPSDASARRTRQANYAAWQPASGLESRTKPGPFLGAVVLGGFFFSTLPSRSQCRSRAPSQSHQPKPPAEATSQSPLCI
jgi:hypothetical protein